MATRQALIIASYKYEDEGLSQLVAPAQDAEALARVLKEPAVGQFEVKTLVNEPSHKVGAAIEDFFDNRKRDDLLLLYYSGHGIKDEGGRLYFSTPDTHRRRLRFTAIPAASVNDIMMHSRSRRQVLLLDCCFSGAFAKGMVAKGEGTIGSAVGANEQLGGQGRIVITASNALQYAFEGDAVTGSGVNSLFTDAVVRGLETGAADMNGDGKITINELYDYVHDHVTSKTPQQRPEKWELGVQGNIMIARNPSPPAPEVALPEWVAKALTNPDFSARIVAVGELRKLLQSGDQKVAYLAHSELERLSREDTDSTVRGAARGALDISPSAPAQTARPKISLQEEKAKPKPQPELHPSLALRLAVKPEMVDIGGEVKCTVSVENDGDDNLRQVTVKRDRRNLLTPFALAAGKKRRFTFATTYQAKGAKSLKVSATGIASNGKRVGADAVIKVHVREPRWQPDEDAILKRFQIIVSEMIGVEPSEVTPEARFLEELEMDDLDLVELVMALEEEYDIEISDEEAVRYLSSVGDAVGFLKRRAGNAS